MINLVFDKFTFVYMDRIPSFLYNWGTWISNHMFSKVCDEITYPFPNFNGCTVEVWDCKSNFISHFIMNAITYPCRD